MLPQAPPRSSSESRCTTRLYSAREWLQQIFAVSEPTLVEPEEVPNAIPVYTIFGAKGLQSPIVFLMNAIDQSFAGRGSLEDGVRRAYVVTRASERPVISAPLYLRGSTLEHTVGTRGGGGGVDIHGRYAPRPC